jgi:hypothetical protein
MSNNSRGTTERPRRRRRHDRRLDEERAAAAAIDLLRYGNYKILYNIMIVNAQYSRRYVCK